MAAPTIESQASSTGALSNSHDINYPTDISSGDLIVTFFTYNSSATITTPPSGFTQLLNTTSGLGKLACYYKVADGTETGTVSVGFSGNSRFCAFTYRISGAGTIEGSTATGSSVNPNPPSLTHSSGAGDYLAIAVEGNIGGLSTATISAYPSGYTNTGQVKIAYTQLGYSNKDVTSDTENPGAFTLSASIDWIGATVMILGTGGAGADAGVMVGFNF